MNRTELCRSLVKKTCVVMDENDCSHLPNRCLDSSGKAVGYYAVLISYNDVDDTFRIGWDKRVSSSKIDRLATYDAVHAAKDLIESMLKI